MNLQMHVVLDQITLDLWPLAVVLLVALLIILQRRQRSLAYLFCCFVFGIYLLVAVDQFFFPLMLSKEYIDPWRQPFMDYIHVLLKYYIKLIPFDFGADGLTRDVLNQLLLNIAITIPFGFGINFLARIRPKAALWLALGLGFGIELTQLVLDLLITYPYRVVDINDVLMNALGVLIGYGLFRAFAWFYLRLTDRFGLRRWGVTAYLDEFVH